MVSFLSYKTVHSLPRPLAVGKTFLAHEAPFGISWTLVESSRIVLSRDAVEWEIVGGGRDALRITRSSFLLSQWLCPKLSAGCHEGGKKRFRQGFVLEKFPPDLARATLTEQQQWYFRELRTGSGGIYSTHNQDRKSGKASRRRRGSVNWAMKDEHREGGWGGGGVKETGNISNLPWIKRSHILCTVPSHAP